MFSDEDGCLSFTQDEIDLAIETAELPAIDFLEACKLLDVSVVSDQQSSESQFQAPISSSSFQKFLDSRVPLSYCMAI